MPSPDTQWSNVKYLTQGGVIADKSNAATAATIVGTVTQSSTEQTHFSKNTLKFAGGTARVELAAGAKIAAGDFTIDGWIYQTSRSSLQMLWSQYSNSGSGDFANRSIWYIDSTGHMGMQKGSGSVAAASTISLNTWTFVEFTRSGNTLYTFADGVNQSTLSISGSMGDFLPCLGQATSGLAAADAGFVGFMAAMRILVGAARHTSTASYTPPTDVFGEGDKQVAGVVRDASGTPVSRTVRLYRRDTGALLQEAVSDASTGAYGIVTSYGSECERIVLDDATSGTIYNDLIDRVIPA